MEDNFVWQDRETRIDIPTNQLQLRSGEEPLDTITNIEDLKGNEGSIGTFLFTNLRLIWYKNEGRKLNFSIGYDSIVSTEEKTSKNNNTGESKILSVKCKTNSSRYELLFTSLSEDAPNLVSSIQTHLKIYEAGRLFRDFKFKTNLTKDKKLIKLIDESILQIFTSVTFIQNDNSNVGQMEYSTIRFVWFSSKLDNYNMSVPWIQVTAIKMKDHPKYGKVLSIETTQFTGGMNILFYPNGINLDELFLGFNTMWDNSKASPVLGIEIKKFLAIQDEYEQKAKGTNTVQTNPMGNKTNSHYKITKDSFNQQIKEKRDEEDEITDNNYINEMSTSVIYAMNNQDKRNAITDIAFCPELGIAIERLPEGITIDKLWKIIT